MKIEIIIEDKNNITPKMLLLKIAQTILDMEDSETIDTSASWLIDETTRFSIRRDAFLKTENPYFTK